MLVRQRPPNPVEESHKGIHDFLVWERIPDKPCDMNFRLPWQPTWRHRFHLLGLLFFAGVGGGILTFVLQLFISPAVIEALLTHYRTAAVLCLLAVSIAAACLSADQMCTHSIFWMSADPGVDLPTLLTCREAWRRRLWLFLLRRPTGRTAAPLSPKLIHTLRSYPLRGLVVFIATLLPALFGTLLARGSDLPTQGVTLVATVTLGLAAVGLLGAARHQRPLQTFVHYLLHWLYSGENQTVPPWVFRSPLGSPLRRQVSFVFMLLLFVPAVIGLTNWLCLFPADGVSSPTDIASALPLAEPLGETPSRPLFQLFLIATVPPFLFVLTIFAYAGTVICQLDDSLERN
jgi:hypothetical protein